MKWFCRYFYIRVVPRYIFELESSGNEKTMSPSTMQISSTRAVWFGWKSWKRKKKQGIKNNSIKITPLWSRAVEIQQINKIKRIRNTIDLTRVWEGAIKIKSTDPVSPDTRIEPDNRVLAKISLDPTMIETRCENKKETRQQEKKIKIAWLRERNSEWAPNTFK